MKTLYKLSLSLLGILFFLLSVVWGVEIQKNIQISWKYFKWDKIFWWYWLRTTVQANSFARFEIKKIEGLKPEDKVRFYLQVLATNRSSWTAWFPAKLVLVYYKWKDKKKDTFSVSLHWQDKSIKVYIPNVKNPHDKSWYFCSWSFEISANDIIWSDFTMVFFRDVSAAKWPNNQNHVAFNETSLKPYITIIRENDNQSADSFSWDWGYNLSWYNDLTWTNNSWANFIDTDNDWLFDYQEEFLWTDKNNQDTDWDGVNDFLDLSPLIKPTKPTFLWKQKKWMIRIEQKIKALGVDWWVKRWKRWFKKHCNTKFHITYCRRKYEILEKKTFEDKWTKKSSMNLQTYKKALNRTLAEEHFEVESIQKANPSDWLIGDTPKTHDHSPEFSIIYPAKPRIFAFMEYRFFYDYLTDFALAKLRNNEEIYYPSEENHFDYILKHIYIKKNKFNTISLQFVDSNAFDQIYMEEDNNYKILGFMYEIYKSNDFYHNKPLLQSITIAKIQDKNIFSVDFMISEDKALYDKVYMKITPMWIVKNGSNINYEPAHINSWTISWITREIIWYKDNNTTKRTIEEFKSFDELINPIWSLSSYQKFNNGQDHKYKYYELWIITKENWEYNVESIEYKIVNFVNYVWAWLDTANTVVKYIETWLKEKYKVKDIDEIKLKSWKKHWAQTLKYQKVTTTLSVIGDGVTIILNGYELYKAVRQWNYVDITYYSINITTTSLWTAATVAEYGTKALWWWWKAAKIAKLGSKKASVVFAVIWWIVEVSYNAYKYNKTNDPILKVAYGENIAASVINTAINVVSVFSPHTLVFHITWAIWIELYGLIAWEDFAYRVASSEWSAIVFLTEYFWVVDQIPSQLAEEVYANHLLDSVTSWIESDWYAAPYSEIFIDPNL